MIVFEQNRGYGAAIKEGFRQGRGSLVGFIDADGTCDPRYFAEMCRVALEEEADIVLGSRMGPDSKMPSVRKLGNRLYALLLGPTLRPAGHRHGQRHAGPAPQRA